MADLKAFAEQLVNLTVKEVNELAQILKNEYGIEPAAAAPVMMAAASGTIAGDRLNLDLVSLEKVNLYRISMTVNGDSATGSYTAFNPSSASTTGTANGVISARSS